MFPESIKTKVILKSMQIKIRLISSITPSVLLLLSFIFSAPLRAENTELPLISLFDVNKSIIVEMRYATEFNFTSQKVPGYEANKCLLVKDVAQALSNVQQDLLKQGLSLKVYDCYRPQMAVDYFMHWTNDSQEVSMQKNFYPNEKKSELVGKGYIAERSGHSRGDSIDLTLVDLPAATQPAFNSTLQQDCTEQLAQRYADNSVDMGTAYDCFDNLSNTLHPEIQGTARTNRLLLQKVMERHGFKNYKKEWWHYTYIKPYGQKQFYNFPIR
jgi:zinc D-Ala-D-Ala dipeptidase